MPRWPANHKKRTDRNYAKEAAKEDTPESIRDREARNKARKIMEKAGRVKKGDGKEVDHIVPIGGKANKNNYGKSNLQVISRHENRIKQPKRK